MCIYTLSGHVCICMYVCVFMCVLDSGRKAHINSWYSPMSNSRSCSTPHKFWQQRNREGACMVYGWSSPSTENIHHPSSQEQPSHCPSYAARPVGLCSGLKTESQEHCESREHCPSYTARPAGLCSGLKTVTGALSCFISLAGKSDSSLRERLTSVIIPGFSLVF